MLKGHEHGPGQQFKGSLASVWDMDGIRKIFTPHMGLMPYTMTKGRKIRALATE